MDATRADEFAETQTPSPLERDGAYGLGRLDVLEVQTDTDVRSMVFGDG